MLGRPRIDSRVTVGRISPTGGRAGELNKRINESILGLGTVRAPSRHLAAPSTTRSSSSPQAFLKVLDQKDDFIDIVRGVIEIAAEFDDDE